MATNRCATVFLKLFLISTVAIFTSGIATFSSKNEELATDGSIKNTKPWASIDGFRSAKFGMKIEEVKKAIQQDFFIQGGKIDAITHPTEQTQSLGITIKKLLPMSGKSRVVYVPQATKKKDDKMKIALSLSYIEKPEQPDAFQLKENDF